MSVGRGRCPSGNPEFLSPEDILAVIEAVLIIAVEAWRRVLADGKLNDTHRRNERKIAGLLRHCMILVEGERSPRQPEMLILPEVGVTAEDEEMVIGSIDIQIFFSLRDASGLRLECKRVSSTTKDDCATLARRYINTGVLHFVGKYGRGNAWGVMVAFVIDGNVAASAALIGSYIAQYKNQPRHVLRDWTKETRFDLHGNLFKTCHRKLDGSPIELLHLFLPFPIR
ncbi:MAG: hypothetical protein K8R46_00425 [Pirellulales bacterium]|nr:hypothetical protein [Pirellulales bacterium]